MFIRAKNISGKKYAYLVKNTWTKKGPRQKVSKYLGRVIELKPEKDMDFEDFASIKQPALSLVKSIIAFELYLHGFSQKKDQWIKDDIKVDLAKSEVKKNNKKIVLGLNSDFLCNFTLKQLLCFKSSSDEKEAAKELATAFIQAGIPVRQDLFISVFQMIFRPGQTYLKKKKLVILVSGTPATGKSTLSKRLSEYLGIKLIDVNNLIEEKNLSAGFDKKRDCKIIDEEKLVRAIIDKINSSESCVIDSHMSHYVPKKYADFCLITHCSLPVLKKRLKKRGYGEEKIKENMQAEIFDICGQEAFDLGHNIVEINTDIDADLEDIKKKIEL